MSGTELVPRRFFCVAGTGKCGAFVGIGRPRPPFMRWQDGFDGPARGQRSFSRQRARCVAPGFEDARAKCRRIFCPCHERLPNSNGGETRRFSTRLALRYCYPVTRLMTASAASRKNERSRSRSRGRTMRGRVRTKLDVISPHRIRSPRSARGSDSGRGRRDRARKPCGCSEARASIP